MTRKIFFSLQALIALLCVIVIPAYAQQISFPGAEGAGRFTSGGRGTTATPTTVFEVTSLNDDNTAGTLRYALTQAATYRTIVFRVSGTIHLTSKLNIRANTTIAGQTAPGDGICLADYPVVISGDNVILRYIRCRMGDKNQLITSPAGCGVPVAPFTAACMPLDGSGGDDALGNLGNKNIIIDHCSVSWSNDEALTVYRGDSVTMQWNLISEPLNYSYHFETGDVDFEQHGYGGIWGSLHGTFHHNLIAHCRNRNPRFAGNSTYAAGSIESADFRNNVIYNWGINTIYGGDGGQYNIVNNYYKYGPNTSSGVRYRIVGVDSTAAYGYAKYYLSGNYVDGSAANTANNWTGAYMISGNAADTVKSKTATPFIPAYLPSTTHTADEAYQLVLQSAGASLKRDTLDTRVVNDVRNRTGRIIDVQGGYPHATPYASTVNAWPALAAATAPVDTDHDGMPDAWETANGLNLNDATDRGVFTANGYTNLENYLNGITSTPTINTSTTTLNNFLQNVGVPSAVQSYVVSGQGLSGPITVTPPAGYQISANGGTNWYTSTTPLTITPVSGITPAVTVSVRLNAAASGTFGGAITHTSTGATAVNVTLSGTAISTTAPVGTNVIVAKDGSGSFTSIQAAINAAPTGLTTPYIIFIKNGKYVEKINIPSNKPFIQLVGESAAYTIISWNDGASTPATGGGTVGTFNSYTVYVQANDCALLNLTIENTFGDGSQAVALRVDGDRIVVKGCRVLGNQDTMLNNANAGYRQYFRNCYIDGNVDFIFGSARVILDSTVIYAKDRTSSGSSFITAANTQAGQAYGYVFRNCILPPNLGVTSYYLGRPWQNSTGSSPVANNKTVFINSTMSSSILPVGWTTWDAGTVTSLIYYGEYKTKKMDGSLADVSARVPWSYQLSDADAATYSDANLFSGWNPCSAGTIFCNNAPKEIAISNFRNKKTTTNVVFDWNISWAMPLIKYELYRSANRTSGYQKINEVTAGDDTTYNFQLSDALPAAGTSGYYYVVASKGGYLSYFTDTVQISSVPAITVSGTLNAFTQNYGVPSPRQSITVSGVNLTDNIVITPPSPYEVSINGSTWSTSTSPLTIAPTAGTVSTTTVMVRQNSTTLGTFSGTIQFTSTGATASTRAVSGTTSVIPQAATAQLQYWPMSVNATDSAAVRSPAVIASTATFKGFTVSNGTTVATIPAYSTTFGQAFGASADGSGLWASTAPGPGGNLNRTFYEQFTVTPTTGNTVKVDSLVFTAAFYNTSSNTKVGVVYSLSGFATDSADVSTNPGGFASPITLANQATGPTNVYSIAPGSAGPVTINSGQTLTFRMYYSCGSTSTGRYAMVKSLRIIGSATGPTSGTPIITTSTGTVNAIVQSTGGTIQTQSYTVSGTNLSGSIYLVAPANFEISADGGTTWRNSTIPIILAPTNGTVATTTILVRMGTTILGSYTGTIQHISNGATTVNVNVSGSVIPSPVITTTGSLNPFVNNVGSASPSQSYTVSGSSLTGDITVTPPAPFEVSTNGTTWSTSSSPLVLSQSAGAVSATVQVRLNGTATGTYSGTINHTSTGAVAKTVAVTGTTLPPVALKTSASLTDFVQKIPSASAAQSFTINGTSLSNDVVVTPPFRYEISLDNGATWFTTPVTIKAVSNSVNATVLIRLNTPLLGTYAGDIKCTSGSLSSTIAVKGLSIIGKEHVLYPNPAYKVAYYSNPYSTEPATLYIYNMQGEKVKTIAIGAGTYVTEIDVYSLAQGAYVAEYIQGKTKVVSKFHRY